MGTSLRPPWPCGPVAMIACDDRGRNSFRHASDDFLGFAVPKQARRIIPPNQVRIPTDWSFISSCSPPHLAVTQLLLISELWLTLTRTFTVLFMRLHRRTWASQAQRQPTLAQATLATCRWRAGGGFLKNKKKEVKKPTSGAMPLVIAPYAG